MVPKDWDSIPLGKISSVVTSGSRDWARYYSTFGSKFIRMTNLNRNGIDLLLNDLRYVSINSESNDGKRTSLQYGDILISITAELGKIGWVPKDFGEAYINQHTAMVRLDPAKAESKFIAYQLSSHRLNKIINSLNDAGAKAGLNLPTVKSIPVLLPPLPEQKKIAKILSTWDKAITTTEKLLANSEQQKKALMQQLLTRKKRFHKFNKEWIDVHLSDISNIVMGTSPSSRSYNEKNLGLPLIQGNADILNRKSSPRIFTSEITKECTVGDILLSVRAPVGTVAISQHRACIGRGIASIKAKKDFNQEFLYQWFLWFEPKWGSLSQGSTFESISSGDIKSLKLLIPDLEEQQKIAVVLSTIDREIENVKQKLNCLIQEKKALMQQLLTGKKRVKVTEINNA
ncbi:restriction endonuclease subunit S [Legionella pneumophila serogroup 1]|nr:restriction endonuclease subunit S [Legionella pneumophila]HBI3554609.1 restriction endonuclease subunit S [Legionella pneumophila]HCX3489918.1 restriction endonuclease subunit S [Legionella pneumophila]HDI5473861.1 restriction endonuclease subunit S [Legionella pneumophila]